MGFLKKLKNFFEGYYYVVDDKTLSEYIEKEIAVTEQVKVDIVTEFMIFPDGQKQKVLICNHKFTYEGEDVGKGIVYYFGNEQVPYNSITELLDRHHPHRTNYYKIRLELADSEFLKDYMSAHLELNAEEY